MVDKPKYPLTSEVSLVFGLAAVGSLLFPSEAVTMTVVPAVTLASPFLSIAVAAQSGLNLVKKGRSALSKVFSAAACATAAGGVWLGSQYLGSSGLDVLLAPLSSVAGMTLGGAFGLVAYKTSLSDKKPSPPQSLASFKL